jgi:hypothetical protein
MGLIIPAGYALGSFRGLVAGDAEEVVITCGFDLSTGASAAMASDLFDVWAGALDGISTSDWTFVGCTLKEGPTDTGPSFDSTSTPVQGTASFTGAVLNTACLVRKSTLLGGRKGRGRMYTVGQVYDSTYGMSGEIDDPQLGFIDTAWFSILGGWNAVAGVVGPVLLHSDATAPTDIVGLNPVKRLATQRRRLRP